MTLITATESMALNHSIKCHTESENIQNKTPIGVNAGGDCMTSLSGLRDIALRCV